MRRGIVVRRNAQLSQNRPSRDVGAVKRRLPCGDRYAHAAIATLHDERISLEPESIGELRQERIDRRKDAAIREVGTRVRAQRAPVDDDGNGWSRWE